MICQINVSDTCTSCHHLYCKDCISQWLIKNTLCPYYRNNIGIDDLMIIK
jgi:hypothetical protein